MKFYNLWFVYKALELVEEWGEAQSWFVSVTAQPTSR